MKKQDLRLSFLLHHEREMFFTHCVLSSLRREEDIPFTGRGGAQTVMKYRCIGNSGGLKGVQGGRRPRPRAYGSQKRPYTKEKR